MPLLSAATAIYRGTAPATVYKGTTKLWPSSFDWTDTFNRTAANLAAMGNGWNNGGTSATASTNNADLLYLANGFYGRILTPTTSTIPANYGIEVVASNTVWASNYVGIVTRWNGTTGTKFWSYGGNNWQIGAATGHGDGNTTLTNVSGFPAGWTSAGDHTMRLEMRGARADVYADGQQVGYITTAPGNNSGVTGTQVGFCGDSGGTARPWRSIRVYQVS